MPVSKMVCLMATGHRLIEEGLQDGTATGVDDRQAQKVG